jgi:hypothetical protein
MPLQQCIAFVVFDSDVSVSKKASVTIVENNVSYCSTGRKVK